MIAWEFLPVGYALTVLIETPILLAGLSPPHSWRRRVFAGLWLTACTYPCVVLVFPHITGRWYLPVAETFAAVAECAAFSSLFREGSRARDWTAIVAANLASFAAGEWLFARGWLR